MFIVKPLPFVTTFVEGINEAIEAHRPGLGLSRIQRAWLSFCIMAVFVTNSVCWAKFERASIGSYSLAALSWMFRHSKIDWEQLLQRSVQKILDEYGITQGYLVVDDTDKKRSKSTQQIPYVHKLKDKASGGFIQGQCIVFLVLVTPKITLPVGFSFYMPDPELTAWYREDKKLKEQGVPPKQRPPKPTKKEAYPTKQEISLRLLTQFRRDHPTIKVKCVNADSLYGTEAFLDEASALFDQTQVISQLRSNQKVRFRNRELSVEEYFSSYPGTPQKVCLRGGEEITAIVGSARLYVCAHHKKRFVIAVQYEGEEEYRYLVAKDLTWRTIDIVHAHTLRWLVEVFIQDWKSHEGWGTLTHLPAVGRTDWRRGITPKPDPEPAGGSLSPASSRATDPDREQPSCLYGGESHKPHQGRLLVRLHLGSSLLRRSEGEAYPPDRHAQGAGVHPQSLPKAYDQQGLRTP